MSTVSQEHDMCCPVCKQDNDLRVGATVVVKLTPDGVEQAGDHEWNNSSWVRCDSCGFEGEVPDFAVVDYPAEALVLEVRELLKFGAVTGEKRRALNRLLRHFDTDGELVG